MSLSGLLKDYARDNTVASWTREDVCPALCIESQCCLQVRQTAISGDGKIILACCDNSRIHRFDVQPLENSSREASGAARDPS